jgi:hypothetical protein
MMVRFGPMMLGGILMCFALPVAGTHRGLLVHLRRLPVSPPRFDMTRRCGPMRVERALTRLVSALACKVGGLG